MAKLKDAGNYIPKKDEPTHVGIFPTNKVPSDLASAVEKKKSKGKDSAQ